MLNFLSTQLNTQSSILQLINKINDQGFLDDSTKKIFEDLRMTSHWAHKPRLFPKVPQTYGKKILDIADIDMDMVKEYVSEAGLKLI